MGENNILSGGADTLREMRDALTELASLQTLVAELSDKQVKLEKDQASKQKAMNAEIESTVSKRKEEVEASFNKQIEITRARIRSVQSKRGKDKGKQISRRISEETAELHEQIRSQKQEIKGLYKRDRISKLFNNSYFFSMFMPENVGDFCVIMLSVAIMLLIPLAVYNLLPEKLHVLWMAAALYAGVLAICMLVFALIFKKVRTKHLATLSEARDIRDSIRRIRKRIKRQEKTIRKDKDESGYELTRFDTEIKELEAQVAEIIEEQKRALTDFEQTAKKDVSDEIRIRYVDELDRMKNEAEAAYNEQRTSEDRIKQLNLDISVKYESYMGKDMMNVATIDSLIAIIEGGDAVTISDALVYYKNQLAEAKARGRNDAQKDKA